MQRKDSVLNKKYESTEQKIFRVAYPPVLYYLIMMATQVAVGFVVVFLAAKKMSTANATDSANFFQAMIEVVNRYVVFCNIVSACIGILVFVCIYRYDIKRKERMSLKEELKNIRTENVMMCYCIGITLCTGISLFLSLLPLDGVLGSYEKVSSQLMNGSFIWLFVGLGILVPIAEELLYRGVVYLRLREYVGVTKAIVISAAVFGLFHFNLLQSTYAFLIGILLAMAVEKFGSIMTSIVMHMAVNQLSVILTVTGINKIISKNIIIYLAVMVILLAVGGLLFAKSEIYEIGNSDN